MSKITQTIARRAVRRAVALSLAACFVAPALAGMFPQPAARLEAARQHPAPDLRGLWVAVLESIPADDPLRDGAWQTWYLSVERPDGAKMDATAALIAAVRVPGIQIVPASLAPHIEQPNTEVMLPMLLNIGVPMPRDDGNFDVPLEYVCGMLCGRGMILVMSHDAAGWHVLSRSQDWIS